MELKNSLIYSTITDAFSPNSTVAGINGRRTSIDFRVGEYGIIKNIGKKGKNLFQVIQTDSSAVKELLRGYQLLRKKRIANTFEYLSLVIGVGSIIPCAIGMNDDEDSRLNGLSVGGGIGVIVGFVGANILKNKTDIYYNQFIAAIKNSIDIYNNNLKIEYERK